MPGAGFMTFGLIMRLTEHHEHAHVHSPLTHFTDPRTTSITGTRTNRES